MRLATPLIAAALAVCLWPAQARAGAWTLKSGRMRVETSYIYWNPDERYVGAGNQSFLADGSLPSPGDRVPLGTDTDGAELEHHTAALKLALGLPFGLEFGAYIPVVFTSFTDDASDEGFENNDIGDPMLSLRWQLNEWIGFATDLKIPGSDVPRVATELPISEGQIDWTLWQRSGYGFGWHGWAEVDIGYRIRFEFDENLPPEQGGRRKLKPGNEFLVRAGGGWRPLQWRFLAVMFHLDGLFGADGEDRSSDDGVVFQLPRREILELQPSVYVEPGLGFGIQIGAGIPVYGRNYPAGPRAIIALSNTFSIWGE